MQSSRLRFGLPALLVGGTFLAAGVLAAGLGFTQVPSANPRVAGLTSPNLLPAGFTEALVAQGSNAVENPVLPATFPGGACPTLGAQGLTFVTPATPPNPASTSMLGIGFYGYDTTLNGSTFSDAPMVPAPLANPASTRVEASKTEPDENTYLVLNNQHGPDASYNYGTHFLFQGHEIGRGYITRVNLDADGAHRVTVMADHDSNGCPLPAIDGSGWDPFAQRLLFTSESPSNQTFLQATPGFPSTVDDLTSQMGHGGYEGVITDDDGNIIIVEDIGGNSGSTTNHLNKAKQPNSFVYRFVPFIKGDLKQGGMMQVLQVASLAHSGPIKFTAPASSSDADKQAAADADIHSQDVLDVHTYGKSFDTTWVTIHNTSTCPTPATCTSWNANTLAKTLNGTPFKRPENGRFRPGSDFKQFIFDETADTDATAVGSGGAGAAYGQFGAIFKLRFLSGASGKLTLLYNAPDAVHAGFDNAAFLDTNHIVFVEDAGDTLHGQRNALDSAWMFDVRTDYSNPSNQPKRIMAEGRDVSATTDAGFGSLASAAKAGFQNEGDNEITGWITSDGEASVWGLLGRKSFEAFEDGSRTFFTQQHGENFTWEILKADNDKDRDHDRDDHDDHDRRDNDHDHDRDDRW